VYDELYEAWRKEKENVEIQRLSNDFFFRLTQYVKRLREEARMLDGKTTRGRLLFCESRNVRKLGRGLIQLRYRKILRMLMAGETVGREGLTDDEVRVIGEVAALTESYQNFLKAVLSGRSFGVEVKEKPKKRVLRFLKEIPAVVGADLKTYGPFKPEDVASVPVENARVFVKQGLAVEVDVSS